MSEYSIYFNTPGFNDYPRTVQDTVDHIALNAHVERTDVNDIYVRGSTIPSGEYNDKVWINIPEPGTDPGPLPTPDAPAPLIRDEFLYTLNSVDGALTKRNFTTGLLDDSFSTNWFFDIDVIDVVGIVFDPANRLHALVTVPDPENENRPLYRIYRLNRNGSRDLDYDPIEFVPNSISYRFYNNELHEYVTINFYGQIDFIESNNTNLFICGCSYSSGDYSSLPDGVFTGQDTGKVNGRGVKVAFSMNFDGSSLHSHGPYLVDQQTVNGSTKSILANKIYSASVAPGGEERIFIAITSQGIPASPFYPSVYNAFGDTQNVLKNAKIVGDIQTGINYEGIESITSLYGQSMASRGDTSIFLAVTTARAGLNGDFFCGHGRWWDGTKIQKLNGSGEVIFTTLLSSDSYISSSPNSISPTIDGGCILSEPSIGTVKISSTGQLIPFEISRRALGTKALVSQSPTINSSSTVYAKCGYSFSYQITVTTLKESSVIYSAENLPFGFSIDPVTGIISGITNVPGNYSITLIATDIFGTSTKGLNLVVARPNPSNILNTPALRRYNSTSWLEFSNLQRGDIILVPEENEIIFPWGKSGEVYDLRVWGEPNFLVPDLPTPPTGFKYKYYIGARISQPLLPFVSP
jgi:Putative Ig domain